MAMDIDTRVFDPGLPGGSSGAAGIDGAVPGRAREPAQRQELLGTLFRAAHTLKGNSSALGFTAVADVTHVLEDLLDRTRRRRCRMTSAFVTLLLRGGRCAPRSHHAGGGGEPRPRPGQGDLVEALKRAAEGRHGRLRRPRLPVGDRGSRPRCAGRLGAGAGPPRRPRQARPAAHPGRRDRHRPGSGRLPARIAGRGRKPRCWRRIATPSISTGRPRA